MIISIIMPVYNEEKFIQESIESILNQAYKEFELIVINDGSSDNTFEKIEPFLKDKRIKYYDTGKIGKVEAFNFGFSESVGDYICLFAGDDIMLENSLLYRFESLIKNREELSVSCGKLITMSENRKLDSIVMPKGSKGNLSGGGVMFNRAFGNYMFPIPDELPNEDLWIRLHIKYFAKVITHIPKVIVKYRIHKDNSYLNINSFKDFKSKSEKVHNRVYNAHKFFLKKHDNLLSYQDRLKIKNILIAEQYRYNGKWVNILFVRMPIIEKIKLILESNNYFFKIKNIFSRFLMGRG